MPRNPSTTVLDYLIRVAKSLAVVAAALVITPAPLWAYLGARHLLNPGDFWQELALGAIGLFVLGAAQITMLILGIGGSLFILAAIWDRPNRRGDRP